MRADPALEAHSLGGEDSVLISLPASTTWSQIPAPGSPEPRGNVCTLSQRSPQHMLLEGKATTNLSLVNHGGQDPEQRVAPAASKNQANLSRAWRPGRGSCRSPWREGELELQRPCR
ncbi:uncharacterized protein LOC144293815 [Canis aureus]